jgi:molybdenum cofactor biosynthesis enzyme MoaA
MIKKISKTSVETISLTGGEPLLFTNIVSVINCLKKNNINIYLSTNGILLQKFYDDIYLK